MKRTLCLFALVAALLPLLPLRCAAENPLTPVLKRGGYTVSLDLKVSKKKPDSLQRVLELLGDTGPNAFATGFVVGDGLVMTAYHVVSGELSAYKKRMLGFAPRDQLKVDAFVKGCQATVLRVDPEADLALLQVCRSQKREGAPAFQASPVAAEKLLVIARPNGDRTVRHGTFSGPYKLGNRDYLAVKVDGRDGFSGSPVYNDRGEIVGVFSGYDWVQNVAVVSPGTRAQKLLEDYASAAKQ